jgi:tetraacyldisaccharide 4'-kinase
MILIKILLYPIALLYGFIMLIRNKLFDWNIIKSQQFDVPVIAVGNLSYGGTGKTPLIEHLVRLLKDDHCIGVISRGYGRKTKGFILANEGHSANDIGDEPLQYLRKFPDVTVALDEKRVHGIRELLKLKEKTEIILLDDAFQHRYVDPGINILLTDFHNLYVNDYPMPTGTLREFRAGASRADIIVITKTPRVFSPILRREIYKRISPRSGQKVFYSFIEYMEPVALKSTPKDIALRIKHNYVILFSGIANSYPLQEHLVNSCNELIVKNFPDHHKYTQKDIHSVINTYNSILSKDKVIFTTEKDAMRLEQEGLYELLEDLPVYYIPIRIQFHQCDELRFDKLIRSYVNKNK